MGESFAGITVPDGDPGGLRDAASDLARVAGGLDDSASTLRSMPGGLAWQGLAAGGFASSCVTSSSAAGQSANGVRMVAPALARCADDLEDAQRDARAAIVDAKEAKREIKVARAALAKAGGARQEAEGRSVAAEIVLTTTGVFGAPSDAAAEAKRTADSEASEAAGEEQRAGRALERAEAALERAQKKGNDAEQDARDADRVLAAVFGAAGLFVGQSPPPPPPPPAPKDEPGFWEKAWDDSLGRLGDGTPLQGPLMLAEHLSPGFREDFGREIVEGTAVGVKDLAVTGVQLSPTYRLVDPAGQDRKAAQLRDTAKFAWNDPGEFLKQAGGVNHLEDGHPGSFFGGWATVFGTAGAGAALRGTTALSRVQRAVPEPIPDLTTRGGARTTMEDLTDRANRELGEDINRARPLLSRREFEAAQENARIAPMSYGKAVERRVAELLRQSPALEPLKHLGGPNRPDFTVELKDGEIVDFDVTTDSPREVPRHLGRPYGEGLELIPYRRPDGLSPFPPSPDP